MGASACSNYDGNPAAASCGAAQPGESLSTFNPLRFGAKPIAGFSSVAASQAAFAASPIDPSWLVEGASTSEAAEVVRTDNGIEVYLWRTTRTHYRWVHGSDEVMTILQGEVFVRSDGDPEGAERRLGPGDVAFFPAGARTVWRVPDRLLKVSTLVRPLPRTAAVAVRTLRKVKRRLQPWLFGAKRSRTDPRRPSAARGTAR